MSAASGFNLLLWVIIILVVIIVIVILAKFLFQVLFIMPEIPYSSYIIGGSGSLLS